MKTLADEILSLMVDTQAALSAETCADRLAVTVQNVREAMHKINEEGRADLVRIGTSKQLLLVWRNTRSSDLRNICVRCHKPFLRPENSKRRCCCQSCSCAMSWRGPGVKEARIEGIKIERRTPAARARLAAHNKRRWAKPEQHANLSEDNKRRWADPEIKAKMARGIRRIRQLPEKRAASSEIKKRQWKEDEYRKNAIAGIKRSKSTPEARAKFSKLLSDRWKDPVMREKYTRANAMRNTPELRAKAAARFKEFHANPENSAAFVAKVRATRKANFEAKKTPERLAMMLSMLGDHQRISDIAIAMGECYGFVGKWARSLGLKSSPVRSEESRAKVAESNRRAWALKRAAASEQPPKKQPSLPTSESQTGR